MNYRSLEIGFMKMGRAKIVFSALHPDAETQLVAILQPLRDCSNPGR